MSDGVSGPGRVPVVLLIATSLIPAGLSQNGWLKAAKNFSDIGFPNRGDGGIGILHLLLKGSISISCPANGN